MTATDVFAKISGRQVVALMMHSQLADYFDFLNLHGFKRWSEYQYLDESIGMRKTHRYHINHYNLLVPEQPAENPNVIPMTWFAKTRFEVQNKRMLSITALEKWREWERGTKAFLSEMYVTLQQQKDVAGASFVVELVKDVDAELKCLERVLIQVKDASEDYLLEMQGEFHERYKDLTIHVGEQLKM